MNSFDFIEIPPRSQKPRHAGITMVLDKNLGIRAVEDLIDTAGSFIDAVKLGWGTSRITSPEILAAKIKLYRTHSISVCPGGTFFEIAYLQNKLDPFLSAARTIGFDCIEISDGTVSMPHSIKIEMIKTVRDAGFTAFSEIGKKFEMADHHYPLAMRIKESIEELKAGSSKIIIEARESGKTGIFNKDEQVIQEIVDAYLKEVGMENVIFEAPLPQQQEWLIINFGNTVNLGNISPADCVNLETLRCGLRAGTLKQYHYISNPAVCIENGIGGALAAASRDNVIIIVDALRASTTIVTALAHGAKTVQPVNEIGECTGEITAGERGGRQIPGLDHDNSPLIFKSGIARGKTLSLTATNGTECIRTAGKHGSPVLIGSLVNAKAAAQKALGIAKSTKRDIAIVMAGRNNELAIEDLVTASEIMSYLSDLNIKGYIKPVVSPDIVKSFLDSDSGQNLISLGKEEDVLFCAQKDLFDVVPVYENGFLVVKA